ncbi:MAG: ABC transporter permease [Nanoarchaeota archaeon]
MISSYFSLAVKNLRKRRLRSWLTILGIVISIMTIFVLISVSLGLKEAVAEQFRLLGVDKFFIVPRGQLAGPGTSSASILTEKDVEIVEKASGVKDLSYIIVQGAVVEFNDEKRFLNVLAFPAERDRVFKELESYKEDEGRPPDENTNSRVTLGSQFKYNNVFSKPVRAGDKININNLQFKVSGIWSNTGDSNNDRLIYMFLHDFEKISNKTAIDEIIIQVESGEDVKETAERVERKLQKSRGVNEKTQDFNVLAPEELLESVGAVLNIITGFLFGISVISLLVGAIGIATTMYTSVLERTRDIGVMKAVGARNSDILLLFVIESGFLGIIGGVFGVVLGIAISKLIAYTAFARFGTTLLRSVTPFYLIIGCLVFAFLIGAVSGAFPAFRAARTRVVEALRYE